LATIQDVASKQNGVLATFLHYGTIFVQTAATTELFEFSYVPNPFKIKALVLDAQDKLEYEAKTELGKIVSGRKIQRPQSPARLQGLGAASQAAGDIKDDTPEKDKQDKNDSSNQDGPGAEPTGPITSEQERIIKKGFPGIQ